jgi:hypothetical protein
MQVRKLLLSAAAIAAIAPSIVNASPENTALSACAKAFASSIASPGSTAPSFKLNYAGNQPAGALIEYYSREYTFFLQAHDPKSGATVASATCSANSNGAVIALTATPVSVAGPALAARLP